MTTVVLVGGAGAGASRIRERFGEIEVCCVDPANDDLGEALAVADAVVGFELSRADLESAHRLRLIQVLGAGVDGIDLTAIPEGCSLCNVHEHEVAIGEWVLMVMLALTRRLVTCDRELRQGRWGRGYVFSGTPSSDLRGRVVGVIGVGAIGAEVARLARAVGMDAIGVTRKPDDERSSRLGLSWLGTMSQLPDLLRQADFVVVAVPLAEGTHGLIGAPELELIGPSGYLLNVARGAVVDEQALYEALSGGVIAGAGLDVWYRYPERPDAVTAPGHFPFEMLDNVVMTPHISGYARSTFERRFEMVVEQIGCLVEGRPFRNVLTVGPESVS